MQDYHRWLEVNSLFSLNYPHEFHCYHRFHLVLLWYRLVFAFVTMAMNYHSKFASVFVVLVYVDDVYVADRLNLIVELTYRKPWFCFHDVVSTMLVRLRMMIMKLKVWMKLKDDVRDHWMLLLLILDWMMFVFVRNHHFVRDLMVVVVSVVENLGPMK